MVTEHGGRSLLLWLWILSRLDRTSNAAKLTQNDLKSVGKLVGMYSKSVLNLLQMWIENRWIVSTNPLCNGFSTVISSPNYAKYHRSQFLAVSQRGTKCQPSEPNRTEPSEPNHLSSLVDSSSSIPKAVKVPSLKELPRARKAAHAVPATGAPTWDRYAEAYRTRYSVDPVRNARVNSQLAQLVTRLGQEEAPQVAAWYLTHNRPLYVQARHPVSLLLRDAEGLHTEWRSGVKATSSEARNAELKDNVIGQAERVIVSMQRKGTL